MANREDYMTWKEGDLQLVPASELEKVIKIVVEMIVSGEQITIRNGEFKISDEEIQRFGKELLETYDPIFGDLSMWVASALEEVYEGKTIRVYTE